MCAAAERSETPMSLQLPSPCKVNLLLNILRRRADGFHELETIFQPVALHDQIRL